MSESEPQTKQNTRKEPNLAREIAFERLVSAYFRVTLLISAILMFTGIFQYVLNPYPFDLTNITTSVILVELFKFSPIGLMILGITILVLIPFGRVVILMVYYFSNSDYRMSMVSFTVMVFMLIGMIFNFH